jgi:hypothetical protein
MSVSFDPPSVSQSPTRAFGAIVDPSRGRLQQGVKSDIAVKQDDAFFRYSRLGHGSHCLQAGQHSGSGNQTESRNRMEYVDPKVAARVDMPQRIVGAASPRYVHSRLAQAANANPWNEMVDSLTLTQRGLPQLIEDGFRPWRLDCHQQVRRLDNSFHETREYRALAQRPGCFGI